MRLAYSKSLQTFHDSIGGSLIMSIATTPSTSECI